MSIVASTLRTGTEIRTYDGGKTFSTIFGHFHDGRRHNRDIEQLARDTDDAVEAIEEETSREDDFVPIDHDPYGDDYLIDGVGFADPGGRSSLRAETESNPRDQRCPTCGRENVLTRIDRQRGYQCDRCADRAEGRMGGDY